MRNAWIRTLHPIADAPQEPRHIRVRCCPCDAAGCRIIVQAHRFSRRPCATRARAGSRRRDDGRHVRRRRRDPAAPARMPVGAMIRPDYVDRMRHWNEDGRDLAMRICCGSHRSRSHGAWRKAPACAIVGSRAQSSLATPARVAHAPRASPPRRRAPHAARGSASLRGRPRPRRGGTSATRAGGCGPTATRKPIIPGVSQ